MSDTCLMAPAKLNIFLHVLRRRADGFHELQTVFQLLDIGDRVELRLREDGEIRRPAGSHGIEAEDDLAVRAARLLKTESGTRLGCDIALTKVIPVGGGMGGGSSDAAAVLVGLNEMWGLGLDEARLAELGLSLGADVPLFVRGFTAFAEGVGEKLAPVSLGDTWYLVVTPHSGVATGEVFRHPALTRNSAPLKIDRFTRDMVDGATRVLDFAALWRATRNDCEAVVRGISPPVDAAFRWLGAYAEARLTGTGASVFAPFPSGAEAERVRERLPDEFRGIVARGVDRAVRRCAD